MLQADLFAGAIFITQATQIEGDSAIYIATLILLAIASVFTVVGGLSAVIWTDLVQTVLMLIGALILCGIGTKYNAYHSVQHNVVPNVLIFSSLF